MQVGIRVQKGQIFLIIVYLVQPIITGLTRTINKNEEIEVVRVQKRVSEEKEPI